MIIYEYNCEYINGKLTLHGKSHKNEKIVPITVDKIDIIAGLIKFTDHKFFVILKDNDMYLTSFERNTCFRLKDYRSILNDPDFHAVRKNIKENIAKTGYVLKKDGEIERRTKRHLNAMNNGKISLAAFLAAATFALGLGSLETVGEYDEPKLESDIDHSYTDISEEQKVEHNILDLIDSIGTDAVKTEVFGRAESEENQNIENQVTNYNTEVPIVESSHTDTFEEATYVKTGYMGANEGIAASGPSNPKIQTINDSMTMKHWKSTPANTPIDIPDGVPFTSEGMDNMDRTIKSIAENIDAIKNEQKINTLLSYCNFEDENELNRFADFFLEVTSPEIRETRTREDVIDFLYSISQIPMDDKIESICNYYGITRDQLLVVTSICVAEGFGGGEKYIDPFAVGQTLYNRTISTESDWIRNSDSIYAQATQPGQFDVYANGMNSKYLNYNLVGSKAALDAIYGSIADYTFHMHDWVFFVSHGYPLRGFAAMGINTSVTERFVPGGNDYFGKIHIKNLSTTHKM